MTTREEINQMRAQTEARRAERKADAIVQLNRDFPDLVIDDSKLIVSSYEDAIYQPDNMTYYEVSYCYNYVNKYETDLAWAINWNDTNGYKYQLIETPSYIVMASMWSEYGVNTTFYWKSNGKRCKGKRHHLAVNKTGKGLYVMIGRQRYYRKEATV